MITDRRQIREFGKQQQQQKEENMKGQLLITLAPKIVRIGIKAIKLSKDGFTKEELREIGTDLLEMGLEILEDVNK